jgi:hypothetical protein
MIGTGFLHRVILPSKIDTVVMNREAINFYKYQSYKYDAISSNFDLEVHEFLYR